MSKKKKAMFGRAASILLSAFVVCSCLPTVFCFTLSHYDLEGVNKTCDDRATCEANTKLSRVVEDINWIERNCLCDELCARYGDCCVNSPYFVAAEQRRGAASFQCIDLRQFGGIYMVTSCPPGRGSMNMRMKCEVLDNADPLSTLPVTSHKTKITYRNAQCAACHNDLDVKVVDFWKPRLECPSLVPTLLKNSSTSLLDSLSWDKQRSSWGLNLSEWHECHIDPVLPETSSDVVRRCQPDTVYACAINWTNSEVRNRCEAYTSLVYDGVVSYRNPHCAMCNNRPLQNLACYKSGTRSYYNKDFYPNAFSILFDLTGEPNDAVGKESPCQNYQLYDPFFKKCRNVVCPNSHEFVNGECVVQDSLSDDDTIYFPEDITNDITGPNHHSTEYDYQQLNHTSEYNETEFDRCPKFLLDPEDYTYTADNRSIYIKEYGRSFDEDEFRIQEDDSVQICAGSLGTRLVNKFGQYMGYITAIGLGISIFFLILHIVVFFLLPDLQNLSGKNLASLCVSLLFAYCSFLSGQFIAPATHMCITAAVVTHYAFLASFFWMLTMAFDIWRTLKLATFELRVSSGKQWKKFLYYSLWSWTAPLILVIAAIATDNAPPNTVNLYIRPMFGLHSCWFGHREALLLFFAAPLSVIMILNIVFFSASAHMIFSSTSTTRYTASGSTQRDFRLYFRLAVVMGLTWVSGLLAGYLDIEVLWYLFIALNTLQGLFIFLCFTCNEKVIKGIKELWSSDWDEKDSTENKDRRPPSFSWSGTSSDTTNKSNLGSDDGGKLQSLESNIKTKFDYNTSPRKGYDEQVKQEYNDSGPISHIESLGSVNSRKKMFELNTKLAYEANSRKKSFDIFPSMDFRQNGFGTGAKLNPLYSSNATYDRRHLDDTLY